MGRKLMRILDRLRPSEPLFPFDPDIIPIYPERLPPVVRNWCVASIAVNVVTLVMGTFVFRNLAPVLVFLVFTLFGPVNLLLFWRSLAQTLNRSTDRIERTPLRSMLGSYPSIEWLAISALVATSAMNICLLVLLANLRPG